MRLIWPNLVSTKALTLSSLTPSKWPWKATLRKSFSVLVKKTVPSGSDAYNSFSKWKTWPRSLTVASLCSSVISLTHINKLLLLLFKAPRISRLMNKRGKKVPAPPWQMKRKNRKASHRLHHSCSRWSSNHNKNSSLKKPISPLLRIANNKGCLPRYRRVMTAIQNAELIPCKRPLSSAASSVSKDISVVKSNKRSQVVAASAAIYDTSA